MDNFKFDPRKHVYTLDGKPLQGVTSVLGVIAKPALIQWAANMACEYIKENGREIDLDELVGWVASPEVLKEAAKAHTRKKDKAASQGTDTHAQIEEYVKDCINKNLGQAMARGGDVSPALFNFSKWAIENSIKFIESEKRMYSREWWTAGTTDLVFEKDGQRFVGDVKTMKKLWDVTPFIQCAAYAKMLSESGEKFDGTCIINIPKETNEVETFYRYDLENDIKAFESALYLYRTLNP